MVLLQEALNELFGRSPQLSKAEAKTPLAIPCRHNDPKLKDVLSDIQIGFTFTKHQSRSNEESEIIWTDALNFLTEGVREPHALDISSTATFVHATDTNDYTLGLVSIVHAPMASTSCPDRDVELLPLLHHSSFTRFLKVRVDALHPVGAAV